MSTLERVSFRFDKKLVKQLRKAAKERKQTQKVIVTDALEAWFVISTPDQPIPAWMVDALKSRIASQQKVDSAAPTV